jgi:hypothetical protein
MTGRIDVSFMGREPHPILVKTARRIEHDSRWRGVKGIATGLAVIALIWAAIVVWWCV